MAQHAFLAANKFLARCIAPGRPPVRSLDSQLSGQRNAARVGGLGAESAYLFQARRESRQEGDP